MDPAEVPCPDPGQYDRIVSIVHLFVHRHGPGQAAAIRGGCIAFLVAAFVSALCHRGDRIWRLFETTRVASRGRGFHQYRAGHVFIRTAGTMACHAKGGCG